MVHLGQIMVVGSQPENRDSIDSGLGSLLCQFDCGERLVNREHGAAEKSYLLPSDDRRRTLAQALEVGKSLRRGVPGSILALKNRGDTLAPRGIVGDLCGFRFDPF